MRWIAAHTWLLFLLLIVAVVWVSAFMGKPLNLLKDTEVDYLGRDTVLAMHLLGEGQERAKTVRYKAEVDGGSRVLLYLQNDSMAMPVMGDVLMVQTKVRRGGRLGDFDYGLYLRRQGIVGTCWAHRGNWQWIGHEQKTGVRAVARQCQYRLHEQYKKMGIDGKE